MDLRRYQLEETLSNLTLLQSHLEDLLEGKDRRFCLDCALKHASAVLGLAKENSGFWPDEEIWPELRDWASRLLWALPSLERTTARSWRDECREFRKRVASLIGGECPTCQEVRPIMKVLVRKPGVLVATSVKKELYYPGVEFIGKGPYDPKLGDYIGAITLPSEEALKLLEG